MLQINKYLYSFALNYGDKNQKIYFIFALCR